MCVYIYFDVQFKWILFSFILCHALSSLKCPNRFLCAHIFFFGNNLLILILHQQQTAIPATTTTITTSLVWKSLERISFGPCPLFGCLMFSVWLSSCFFTPTNNIFTLTSFNLICEYFSANKKKNNGRKLTWTFVYPIWYIVFDYKNLFYIHNKNIKS